MKYSLIKYRLPVLPTRSRKIIKPVRRFLVAISLTGPCAIPRIPPNRIAGSGPESQKRVPKLRNSYARFDFVSAAAG